MLQRKIHFLLVVTALAMPALVAGCSPRQSASDVEAQSDPPAGRSALVFDSKTPVRRTIGAGAEKLSPRSRIPRRVLALYYPWYRMPARSLHWAHQEGVDAAHKHMLSHAHYPTLGPYDSTDPAVLDRHLKQAAAAGIDTLVCSWWGPKDATDEAVRFLLQRAAKSHVTVCVLWEQYEGMGGGEELRRNLNYLLQTFARQPAYLKMDNRPVVFVYERVRRSALGKDWADALNDTTHKFPPGVFIVGDGRTHEERLLWDGQYSLFAPDRMAGETPEANARAQHRERLADLTESRKQNHLSVATLMPGYDDRRYNLLHNLPNGVRVEREDGALYAALWKQAIADDPDWLLISSFNQWHAGNEIEPSLEMGDRYLTATRQYANRFKAAASASK